MKCEEFLELVVYTLTGEPADIKIVEDEYGAIITIHVVGKVSSLIGKNGVTIDAIRTISKAIGYNGKHRLKIEINEQT